MSSAGIVQGNGVTLLNWTEIQIYNIVLVDNMG